MSRTTEDDNLLQEWKQSQESISTFDKMILEIRKYRFSFITLLLTADGFLLGFGKQDQTPSNGIIMAIFFAILVLIIALFQIDRVHEVFLRSAVLRAMEIEERLSLKLTRTIAYWSETSKTATWGVLLYPFLAFAALGLALAGFFRGGIDKCAVSWAVFALVIFGIAVTYMKYYHKKTKMIKNRKNPLTEDDPFHEYIERASS